RSAMKKTLIPFLAILLLTNVGCMQRRLTVHSNPAGALVYIDNVEIGLTPVSVPFTYYGTRTIRLEKDRFKTVEVQQKINAPWYQIPPLDFVSEILIPYEIRDERQVKVDMQPLEPTNETEVLQRANQIRQNSQQGFAVPR
ncbi:MAG: PEGA domain-containing protein, partial [Planctomycetota bacterium]|nr:PEGA domain-containing protein [Planctomycetota bacterium]